MRQYIGVTLITENPGSVTGNFNVPTAQPGLDFLNTDL
jgi:hypothetical protein